MGLILPQIDHLVVVMLENRSLDNLFGWLYPGGAGPRHYVPAGDSAPFDGLDPGLWNPANASYFEGQPPQKVHVIEGTSSGTVPDPDPREGFAPATFQLYGPPGVTPSPPFPMQGFLVDYQRTGTADPGQVMQGYTPEQIPVLSALAREFAISDRWFCSVPSQTWPNRCFVHAGTSNGQVDNGAIPDPFAWDAPTIFEVLETLGVSWSVYADTLVTPSLTRIMFPRLWGPAYQGRFRGFSAFRTACGAGTLPSYSFLEPSFLVDANDGHPPHEIASAEAFLFAIWQAVSRSPAWLRTLLVITFDEHGGTYDHVLPPTNAATPDRASDPGADGFRFDRFGVRVPTIVVSPWVEPGTVFRADPAASAVPFDHTSILATLRDWLAIPPGLMLPSRRIAQAPTLGIVLDRSAPRPDLPAIPSPLMATPRPSPSMTAPPNANQRSLVAATARRLGIDPREAVTGLRTRADAAEFFRKHATGPTT